MILNSGGLPMLGALLVVVELISSQSYKNEIYSFRNKWLGYQSKKRPASLKANQGRRWWVVTTPPFCLQNYKKLWIPASDSRRKSKKTFSHLWFSKLFIQSSCANNTFLTFHFALARWSAPTRYSSFLRKAFRCLIQFIILAEWTNRRWNRAFFRFCL